MPKHVSDFSKFLLVKLISTQSKWSGTPSTAAKKHGTLTQST